MLQIENIHTHVLGNISFSIDAGVCVCLSGASGSGKTSLLRAIADLDPHQGRVLLDNRDANEFKAHIWRQQVGLLLAESEWWEEQVGAHFKVKEYSLIKALGFDGAVMDFPVSQLSTGERQRLALLRLLCNQPRVLLLDEPTGSLDPENTLKVEQLIKNYMKEKQTAVLWVSHDPAQIKRVSDRHYRLVGNSVEAVS